MKEIEISILLATFKRESILRKTLDALSNLKMQNRQYEIIVIDNAGESQIKSLVEFFSNKVAIKYLCETSPGKNAALLAGLKLATGNLLVFIDDDIMVSSDWMDEMLAGSERLPEYDIFGGKILPYLAPEIVDELNLLKSEHPFLKSAYGIADWGCEEGAVRPGQIWGGNMAVRRRVFDAGITFSTRIGPTGENYAMSGETEFIQRAYNAGFKGAYLPQSLVFHQIRQDQLNLEWLMRRAFMYGRGLAIRNKPKNMRSLFGVPIYHVKKLALIFLEYISGKYIFRKADSLFGIDLYIQKGFVYQLWLDRKSGPV